MSKELNQRELMLSSVSLIPQNGAWPIRSLNLKICDTARQPKAERNQITAEIPMIAITLRMTRPDSSALGPEEDKLQCKEGHDNKHEIPEEYSLIYTITEKHSNLSALRRTDAATLFAFLPGWKDLQQIVYFARHGGNIAGPFIGSRFTAELQPGSSVMCIKNRAPYNSKLSMLHLDILSSWVTEFPPEGRWTKRGWRTEKKDRMVFKGALKLSKAEPWIKCLLMNFQAGRTLNQLTTQLSSASSALIGRDRVKAEVYRRGFPEGSSQLN
ncbi:hypothetical protein INR49_005338 [Caranx melampygus]|nr:hypothetical protein INR49_005338 [Caranx melampygus]